MSLDRGPASDDTPVVDRLGRWLGILVVLFAVAGAEVRVAQASPLSASELRARQDFAAGRYDEAIEIFAELYAKTADPIFLRNIGRCYQKQKRADEAIANFREYLNKAKKWAPGEKEEIEGYIRDLEASRTQLKPAEPAAATTTSEHAAPAAEAPAAPHPTATESGTTATTTANEPAQPASNAGAARASSDEPPHKAQLRATAEPRSSGGGSVSVPGVVLAIAGVAALGGGVVFGLAARSAATAVASQYDPARETAGKRDATLQWVGYGVGAAALVTGVILLVRGPGQPDTEPGSVQVGLGLGPDIHSGAGATLSGRF